STRSRTAGLIRSPLPNRWPHLSPSAAAIGIVVLSFATAKTMREAYVVAKSLENVPLYSRQ
ncbi:Hypothetical protein FKW44_015024, partial [Caligus rogercresseyi]